MAHLGLGPLAMRRDANAKLTAGDDETERLALSEVEQWKARAPAGGCASSVMVKHWTYFQLHINPYLPQPTWPAGCSLTCSSRSSPRTASQLRTPQKMAYIEAILREPQIFQSFQKRFQYLESSGAVLARSTRHRFGKSRIPKNLSQNRSRIARNPLKIAQNCSYPLKIAQNCSHTLKIA